MKKKDELLNIGVCCHGQHAWITILSELKPVGLKLSFVTAAHELVEDFEASFPDAVILDIQKITRGMVKEQYSPHAIGREDIKLINSYWKYICAIFDRFEINSNKPKINNYEKNYIVNTVVGYYCSLLVKRNISFVYFADYPHGIYDLCMYMACHIVNKKSYILQKTPSLPHHAVITDSLFNYNDELAESVSSSVNSTLSFEGVYEIIMRKKKDYNSAEPDYMVKQKSLKTHGSLYSYLLKPNKLRHIFKHKTKIGLQKIPFESFLDSPKPTKSFFLGYIYQSIMNYEFKKKLSKTYAQQCMRFDVSEITNNKYIFFALHYQPEATTLPSGGEFYDQETIIRLISASIPDDYILLVKEHPSVLIGPLPSIKGRWDQFYKRMNLDNVYFVSNDADTFKLIDCSEAVATVSGTVAFEALARKRKVLLFGFSWYGKLKGVFKVNKKSDIIDALETEYPYSSSEELANEIYNVSKNFIAQTSQAGDFLQNSQEITCKILFALRNAYLKSRFRLMK